MMTNGIQGAVQGVVDVFFFFSIMFVSTANLGIKNPLEIYPCTWTVPRRLIVEGMMLVILLMLSGWRQPTLKVDTNDVAVLSL